VLLKSSSWLSPEDFRGLMVGLLAWPLEGGVLLDGDLGVLSREAAGVELADSGSGDRRELMSIFVDCQKYTVGLTGAHP
jgi:hypothetical protein